MHAPSRTFLVSMIIHVGLASVLIGWSFWAAYTFWAQVFGTPWAAVGMLAVVETGALAGFALHIARARSPLTWARHALPIASSLPAIKSVHDLAAPQVGTGWGWVIAGIVIVILVVVAWAVWTGLEQTLLDRSTIELEAIERRATEGRRYATLLVTEARLANELLSVLQQITSDTSRPMLAARGDQPAMPDPVLAARGDQPAMPDPVLAARGDQPAMPDPVLAARGDQPAMPDPVLAARGDQPAMPDPVLAISTEAAPPHGAATEIACPFCQSPVVIEPGKSVPHARAAIMRHGCNACRQSRRTVGSESSASLAIARATTS